MRDINKRFISDQNSTAGRPKAFTHKWECFEKLRMYEQIGSIGEFRKYKEIFDILEKSIVFDKIKEQFNSID